MKHLTDAALMEILYGDEAVETPATGAAHLAECSRCQARLARFRRVAAHLSAPAAQTDSALRAPSGVQPMRRLPSAASERRRGLQLPLGTAATAAGLVVALGAGFWGGIRWHAGQIEQAVARASASRAVEAAATVQALRDNVAQCSQDLQGLTTKLAAVAAAQQQLQTRTLPEWETVLTRLIENQSQLRQELETLAVSAASEIALAKRTIQNLESRGQNLGRPPLQ